MRTAKKTICATLCFLGNGIMAMQGLSREGQLPISGNAPEASLVNDCFKCPTLTIGFLRRRVGRFDLKIQFRRVLVEEGGAAAEVDHVGLIFDTFVIENFDGLLQCSYVPSPCNDTQPCLFGLKVALQPCQTSKTAESWAAVEQARKNTATAGLLAPYGSGAGPSVPQCPQRRNHRPGWSRRC